MSGRPPKRGGAAYNLRLVLEELQKLNKRLKRIEAKLGHLDHEVSEIEDELNPRINLEAHLVKGLTP